MSATVNHAASPAIGFLAAIGCEIARQDQDHAFVACPKCEAAGTLGVDLKTGEAKCSNCGEWFRPIKLAKLATGRSLLESHEIALRFWPAVNGNGQQVPELKQPPARPSAEAGPKWLDVRPEGIAPEVRESLQCIIWAFEPQDFKDPSSKKTKIPYNSQTLTRAKSNDPKTWSSFDSAFSRYANNRQRWAGVGYMFANGAGIVGIDLDDCRDPETGEIADWARETVERFDTYSEVSPSGTGIKMLCRGKMPGDGTGKNRPYKSGSVEIYGSVRFFALTGHRLPGLPSEIVEAQAAIDWLWAEAIEPTLSKPANGSAKKQHVQNEQVVSGGRIDIVERARRYIATKPPAIAHQRGHDTTFDVACSLVLGFDLTQEQAWPLLVEYNERCQPPWSERELRHKLDDADKKPDERGYLRDAKPEVGGQKEHKPKGGQKEHLKSSVQDDHLNGPATAITNGVLVETVDNKGKEKTEVGPKPMARVLADIRQVTGDWPRRVGGALFVDRGDAQVDWLETPASAFGWLGSKTGIVHWHRGTGFATKEETFSELRRTATAYDAVETLPHFPSMPGHFYACKPAKIGNGDTLRRFLDRFRPSTQIDYDLFLAAVVTPFWGGPPGCRPAFMWISDSGRGAGKSKNAAMVARVAGGVMDFSHGEDIATIKARLLSPEGQSCRVAMLDNVKTLRLSWAEIESLITQTTISGKRLYVGEAARPNTITWFITLNGASLSTDMAQRVIPIKIDPPERVGSWEEETIRFIDDNRQALIDDVAAFFSQPAYPPRQFTRWATWEQHVLARLPEPNEAQAVIRERQGVADVEREEADIIEDHFRGRLVDLCYAAETERVHVPSLIACQWFNEATGEKKGTTAATRAIKQLCDEGKMTCLQIDPSRTHGRGFLWFGESAEVNAVTRTDLASRIETQKRRS